MEANGLTTYIKSAEHHFNCTISCVKRGSSNFVNLRLSLRVQVFRCRLLGRTAHCTHCTAQPVVFSKKPSNHSLSSLTFVCFPGEITNSISLPLDKPFYLYSLSGARCQQVKGAIVKEETVNFDRNAGRYQINIEGDNPFQMEKNGAQMKVTYCYYTPGEKTLCNLIHF